MNCCLWLNETIFASCIVKVLAPVRTSEVNKPTKSLAKEMKSMPPWS